MRHRAFSLLARFGLLLCVAAFLVGAFPASTVYAASTWTVNSAADDGTGTCNTTKCTLRDAIAVAAAGDTIQFSGAGLGAIALKSGLTISKSLTIQNTSTATGVVVTGVAGAAVFTISGGTVTLDNLNITGGGASGIAVNPGATLNLVNSAVYGNSASMSGGGINNNQGTVTVQNSTISGNSSQSGGGISNNGTMTIHNSTIADNTAAGNGGGLNLLANISLYDSVIANNTASSSGPDCYTETTTSAQLQLMGYNIVETPTAYCNASADATTKNVDPKLGALTTTTAPSKFYPLLPGSPAINMVPTANSCNGSTNKDQIGGQRPYYGIPLFAAELCDAGAIEMPYVMGSGVSPDMEAKNAARSTPVKVTSSVNFKAGTATKATFAVSASNSGLVQSGYSISGATATLTPAKPFFAGDLVQVSATTGLLGESGIAALNAPVVWQFHTATSTGAGQFQLLSSAIGHGITRDIALGDYNGDGYLDMAIGNIANSTTPNTGFLAVRRNDKLGGFTSFNYTIYIHPTGDTATNADVVAVNWGDFNGDGTLDVLATTPTFEQILLTTPGQNPFTVASTINFNSATTAVPAVDAAVADVDGDGDLDVIVVENGGARKVYKNDGAGNMTLAGTFGSNEQASQIAMADVDRDGDLDAVVSTKSANNLVYKNNGSGTFAAAGSFGGKSDTIALADLDGDGDPDAVAGGNGNSGVVVYKNNGSGTFATPATVPGTATAVTGLGLADLDGDGDLDLVISNTVRGTTADPEAMFLNNGTGTFAAPTGVGATPTFSAGAETMAVALGDINSDGRVDAAFGVAGFADAANPEVTYINDALPTVAAVTKPGSEDTELTFALADFNAAGIFTDADNDALAKIRIDAAPSSGTLRLYTSATAFTNIITFPAEITAAQLTAGYLRYMPDLDWNGAATFNYAASDGMLYAAVPALVTLNIAPVNDAPKWLDTLTDMTVDEMVPLSIDLPKYVTDVDDTDTTALAYSVAAAPDSAGMSINATSKAFEWTPSEAQGAGVYTVTFTVKDAVNTVAKTIKITVNEVDRAPEFSPVVSDVTFQEEADNSFVVNAIDPDNTNQTVTVTYDALPEGAVFNGNGSTFAWKPSEAQGAGVYHVTFTAEAGGKSVTMPVTITVEEVNKAPQFTEVAAQKVDEEKPLTFDVVAADTDNTNQTVTVTATSLPEGAAFAGKTFTWTPTEAQGPGDYTATFEATDGTDKSTMTVSIAVAEVNKAPVFDALPFPPGTKQGGLIGFQIHATDADIPVQDLVYTAVELPKTANSAAEFDAATQTFTWQTDLSDPTGDYLAKFTVSDGVTETPLDVKVTIRAFNTPPVINNTDVSIKELVASTIKINATDVDGDALTLAVSGLPTGATFSKDTISWKPTEAQGPGKYKVTLSATDGLDVFTKDITITVEEVNAAPTFLKTSYDTSVIFNNKLEFTVEAADSDLPAQTLTYAVEGSLPTWLSFDPATRTFSGTPARADAGTTTIVLTVNDGAKDGSGLTKMNVKITVVANSFYLPLTMKQ